MSAILLMFIFSLSLSFMFLNHPLSFGMILLTETILISVLTGLMNYNFWFSYILFLIMVGGMLILFIYMTSVASNEKFKLSYKLTIFMIFIVLISSILYMADQYFTNLTLFNYDLSSEFLNNSLSMSKYINYPINKIMFMVILYLLVTLIMVVKITNVQYGPLRQKF